MGTIVVEKENDKTRNEGHRQECCSMCHSDYPKRVIFILLDNFFKRSCYYGIAAVLQSYLMLKLGQDADTAASLFHSFAIVAYFMPIAGAVIADSFAGRYWMIASLSVVYVIGNGIMTVSAIGDGYFPLAVLGMFTIATAVGGIKPNLSSLGADQFTPSQAEWQKFYFSLFYLSVNVGALMSMFLTPLVKSMSCFGEDQCWVMAFGIPAICMTTGAVLFLAGTRFYTRVPVVENIALKVPKAVGLAIGRMFTRRHDKVSHWLDRSVPDFTQDFVDDCKALFRVLVLFLPLPFFWALFYQQGSRWTYQAQKMNSYIAAFDYHMEPEQIQLLNPLFIVLFTNLFDIAVYPVLAKCRLLRKPLERMVAGCMLAIVAFIVIGVMQLNIQKLNDVVDVNDPATFRTRVFNINPHCQFNLHVDADPTFQATLQPFDTHQVFSGPLSENTTVLFSFKKITCSKSGLPRPDFDFRASFEKNKPLSTLFFDENGLVTFSSDENSFPVAENGDLQKEHLFQILVSIYTPVGSDRVSKLFLVKGDQAVEGGPTFEPALNTSTTPLRFGKVKTPSKFYRLGYVKARGSEFADESMEFLDFQQGGSYIVYLRPSKEDGEAFQVEVLVEKGWNAVSVYWQVIPYFVITCGEIFFSVTGLSFSFLQAPASMKSVISAAWLLTFSLGNVIDLIVIEIQFENKAVEFFTFAGLMFVVTIIFAVIAYFYKYAEDVQREKELLSLQHASAASLAGHDNRPSTETHLSAKTVDTMVRYHKSDAEFGNIYDSKDTTNL